MKKYRKILSVITAMVLAASTLPGGEVVSRADEPAEEISSAFTDETAEFAEKATAEAGEEVPEEAPDMPADAFTKDVEEDAPAEFPEGVAEDAEVEVPDVPADDTSKDVTEDTAAEFTNAPTEEIMEDTTQEEPETFADEPLSWVEYHYYRPYKTASYELKYGDEDGRRKIRGYRGEAKGKLVIPAKIDDIPVEVISEGSFSGCSGFTGSLVIPEGVTFVNDYAFRDCSGLESISFPAGLAWISTNAIDGCTGLREVINNSEISCRLPENDFNWIDKATGESITGIKNGTAVIDGGYFKPYADASYELKYHISNEGISIIGCTGQRCGKLTIPEKIEGKPVTAIGSNVFQNAGFRGSFRIPSGVTTIGNSAFEGCSGLTGSLTIPSGVTTIGANAFEGCSGLTGSLTIPSGVTIIDQCAFKDCSGFTGKLTLGNSVTEIRNSAFDGCSGFSGDLTIPESVTTIGERAFAGCSGFSGDLTIPEKVGKIGNQAFRGCSGLSGTLTIPSGVYSLGVSVIDECRFDTIINNSVKTLILPVLSGKVRYIDSDSFEEILEAAGQTVILNRYRPYKNASYELTYKSNDTGVTITGFDGDAKGQLILPESIKGKPVTEINVDAFKKCSGLTGALTIPDSVTIIWNNAFNGCSGLTGELKIPNSVTSIGEGAFLYCSGFTGDLTIPEGVTGIGDNAFSGCSGLTGTLTIPDSVTFCGKAFDKCGFYKAVNHSDTAITLLSDNLAWVSEDTGDVIKELGKGTAVSIENYYKPYKNATYELSYQVQGDHICITGFRGRDKGKLIIPEKIDGIPVTKIGKDAFHASNFTGSLTIPGSIRTIESESFEDSTFSGNLTIEEGVTTIRYNAFASCDGFTGSLIIPDSVSTIERVAFSQCFGFTESLTLGEGITEIGENAFTLTRFERIINNSDENIDLPNTDSCGWTKEDNGEAVTAGGRGTYVCTTNKKYKPASGAEYELICSTRSDDTIAIIGCTGKKKGTLVIPEKIEDKTVTLIGESAFEDCSGFTGSLRIPDGVTGIGEYAFSCCSGFKGTLTLPESLTTVGLQAFFECSGFTGDLTFPENLTTIGGDAFVGCSGFTGDLTIPGSVTSIGDKAFDRCTGLNGTLAISEGVRSIGNSAFSECGFTGEVTIPGSVTGIARNAFNHCKGISRIVNNTGYAIELGSVGREGFEWYKEDTDQKVTQIVRGTAINRDPMGRIYQPENAPYEYYYTINDTNIGTYEGVYITAVRGGRKGSLIIPDKIGDKDVVGLGEKLFTDCEDWTGTLKIPGGIRVIGGGTKDLSFHRIINDSDCELALLGKADHAWKDAATGEEVPAGNDGAIRLGNVDVIRSDAYGPSGVYGLTHTVIGTQVYTGKAVKPDMKVYFGKTLLKPKKDYTIKYDNNVTPGEASFTITGKGKYTGTTTDTFTISPGNIADDLVKVSKIPPVTFDDREHTPVPAVKYGSRNLTADNDFTITYYASLEDAEAKTSPAIPKETGEYYARMEGMGNFEGYRVLPDPFIIMEAGVKHVDRLTVGKIGDQAYTGEDISIDALNLTVKDGKTPLVIGVDYTAVCEGKEAGKGTVTIKGKGAYVGTRIVSFNITGIPMKKVSAAIPKSVEYTGVEIRPEITLSYKANKKADPEVLQWKTQEEYDAITDPDEKKEIKCIISFSNNINAGKGTVTLTGINGYAGTVKKTFTIAPQGSDGVSVYFNTPEAQYQKGGAKPKPVVEAGGELLTEGKDYTLSYSNNKSLYLGGGKKKPTVTVRLKGNYKGRKTASFFIIPANLASSDFEAYADNVVYRNKKNNRKTKVTVRDKRSGSVLKEGKDYSVRYSTDVNSYAPVPSVISPPTKVYVFITGKGSYEDTRTVEYFIAEESDDLGRLKAVIPEQEYTGSGISISPSDIKWMRGSEEIYINPYFIRIESCRNNIKPGTATVIVRGTGTMAGTKKITFKIRKRGFRWWWEQ